jgi:hypothetical protein
MNTRSQKRIGGIFCLAAKEEDMVSFFKLLFDKEKAGNLKCKLAQSTLIKKGFMSNTKIKIDYHSQTFIG